MLRDKGPISVGYHVFSRPLGFKTTAPILRALRNRLLLTNAGHEFCLDCCPHGDIHVQIGIAVNQNVRDHILYSWPITMSNSLAAVAKTGFADASSYDKYRPSYPAEAVDELLTALHLAGHEGAKVVDLAAGTGKFTEILAVRPERFDILAVEPHDEMRAELEKKALPGVKVVNGTATSIPVPSKSLDGLVAAQVRCELYNCRSNPVLNASTDIRHFTGMALVSIFLC